MDTTLTLALFLPWAIIAFQGWVIYLLLRQHGRALLSQDDLRTRLERVETRLSARAGSDDDDDDEAEPAGLALGSPAPEFALTDLEGQQRTLSDFLGRPLLVVFFSPQCGFCQRMAPRLGALPADGPRVLLIGQGDPEEHRRLAREHNWQCDIVFQNNWEISSTYQASGTPTGYLLDAQGKVASGLAIGADALLDLVPAAPKLAGANGQVAAPPAPAPSTAAEPVAAFGGASPSPGRNLQRAGLAAGSEAPDFSLPDLDGQQHALADLRGKRALLVFFDPESEPCRSLAPELPKLRQRAGLEVLVISRGDAESNKPMAALLGSSVPLLLQQRWEVSKAYGLFAAPVGYLVDAQGTIAADAAIGADAILKLV